jgi:hypothetical protein
MSYYERINVEHLDGSRIFHAPEDVRAEEEVAKIVASAWQCALYRFGALCPIDWYAVRFERMVAVLELKTRSHTVGTYPTVFLNVRKWLALQMASAGLGVPAIFVVKFIDRVLWVPVTQVDASNFRIGGCGQFVKARSDIEPVIEVDVAILKPLPNTERGARRDA